MQERKLTDVVSCPISASHETTASVPVVITPFADPGPISVECCGCPSVQSGNEPHCGTINRRYEFIISQKMQINIPIAFGADVVIGETYVQNGQTSGMIDGECCTCNCSGYENELEIGE